jgi:hypothetical protein
VGRVAKKEIASSLGLEPPTYSPTYPGLHRYLVHTYWPSSSHALFICRQREREREREREEAVVGAGFQARYCTSPPLPPRPAAGLGWPRCNRLGCFLIVTPFFVSSSLVWFGPLNSLHTQHKLFSVPCSSSDVSRRHNGCQLP